MAANTTNRIRIIARASVQSAIEAGAVAANAWPQRSKTRARRKVARTKRSVDVRSLPSPAAMADTILGQDQFGRRDYEYEHRVLREASEIHKSLATLAPTEMVQALVDVALARQLRALVGGREPVDVQYRSHASRNEIAVSDSELLTLLRYVRRSNSAE